MTRKNERTALILFLCILAVNMAFLYNAQERRVTWSNVPPVPSDRSAVFAGLGDKQFAYRSFGLMIQNLGDIGGRTTPLGDYDPEKLGAWFHYMDLLDPHSNYIPFLAAYYFGAGHNVTNYAPIIDYLSHVGATTENEKWRWLAQAVFIARYKEKDMDKALRLAEKLSSLYEAGMPAWTKQMPAFVTMAMGDEKAAFGIMSGILSGDTSHMHPAEINYMKLYICEEILDETQARDYPLCKTVKH